MPTLPAVLDVNDETPTFFPAVYNVSVSEDVPRDFRVVWLNCTDNDVGLNAELSYFVTGASKPSGCAAPIRVSPARASLRICSWLCSRALGPGPSGLAPRGLLNRVGVRRITEVQSRGRWSQ